jgi:hypothetical protein
MQTASRTCADPSLKVTRLDLVAVVKPPRRLFRARRVSRRSFDTFVARALKAIRRQRHMERKLEATIRRERREELWAWFPSRILEPLEDVIRRRCPTLFLRPRVAAVAAAVRAVREQF